MLGASSRTSRQEFYVNGNAAVPVTLCWLSMAHAIWPICSYVTAIVVQGWIADRRERNVIEPDDAQIVGDSDTESVQRAEQLERAKIIEAQDQIALLLHELARDASEIVARPTPNRFAPRLSVALRGANWRRSDEFTTGQRGTRRALDAARCAAGWVSRTV